MEIEQYLLDKGIKPHYSGFNQLVCAIKLCQKDAKYLSGFTTRLYPDVAKHLDTTAIRVERGIRTAITHSGLSQTISEFVCRAVVDINMLNHKKGEK